MSGRGLSSIPALYIKAMTLFRMRDNLKKLNILEIYGEILDEDGQDVADIVIGQLESGVDGSGNKLEPSYRSTTYALQKSHRNSKPGMFTPDLKDSGDFYRRMRYDPNTDSVDSDDRKRDDLVEKYELEILEVGVGIASYQPKFRRKFKEKADVILKS